MKDEHRPLVWIAISFACGVAFQKVAEIPWLVLLLVLIIFLLLSGYAFFKKINLVWLLLILTFWAGVFAYQIKITKFNQDISLFVDKGYLTLIGKVEDEPRVYENKIIFNFKVSEVVSERSPQKVGGVIRVFLKDNRHLIEDGDKIKVRGQLFSSPYFPSLSFSAYFGEKISSSPGSFLRKFTFVLRKKFREVLEKILPSHESSLLGSLLLGTSVSPLSEETKDLYRKVGLIHLLVVSGMQVSILLGVCLWLVRSINLPLPLGITLTSLANILLVLIVGAQPSILRAAIMGEITLLGLLFERQKDCYTSLALSGLILLLFNPLNLWDIGFQLSFLATWALIYLAPILKDYLFRTSSPFFDLLTISLAPFLATAPLIVFNFNQFSWGSILANFVVLPGIEVLIIFGFLLILLGFIFLPLAQLLSGTIWLMLIALQGIAQFLSSLPGLSFNLKTPTFPLIAGYYLGLIILMEILKKEKKLIFTRQRMTVSLLLFISLFIWHNAVSADLPGGKSLTVNFIDVGQGDSVLIETPNNKKILIDGGGVEHGEDIRLSGHPEIRDKVGEKVVVPFLRRKGINKLDMVILTHPHEDHLGGLNSVLNEIKVDQVLDSGQIYHSPSYKRFLALVRANQIKYRFARAGQVINFSKNLKGYILNPFEPLLSETKSDPNNNSIVMKLIYGDISFLFTGDLEQEGEERVLSYTPDLLPSTILKVGHHGSSTSTTDEFLKVVNPQIAVISVGKYNRYFHPHPSLLERLERFLVKVYRTDEEGTVAIRTDGERVDINVSNQKRSE